MLGHASGMIGLPLRLLAREIYDRVVKARGAAEVALITGEEKIVPLRPRYFVCTVEAMPLDRKVEFLAVDEIQLCADPERGHLFTHRLLHARGSSETMLMGADQTSVEVAPPADPMLSGPIHQMALVIYGVHLLEHLKLDELSAKSVYEFAFILQPMKLQGATGSSVAPIAIR